MADPTLAITHVAAVVHFAFCIIMVLSHTRVLSSCYSTGIFILNPTLAINHVAAVVHFDLLETLTDSLNVEFPFHGSILIYHSIFCQNQALWAIGPLCTSGPLHLRDFSLKKNCTSKELCNGAKKGLKMRQDILSSLFRSLRLQRRSWYFIFLQKFSLRTEMFPGTSLLDILIYESIICWKLYPIH